MDIQRLNVRIDKVTMVMIETARIKYIPLTIAVFQNFAARAGGVVQLFSYGFYENKFFFVSKYSK